MLTPSTPRSRPAWPYMATNLPSRSPSDDADLVVAVGPPDELDAAVELVAPEERHRRVRRRGVAGQLGQQVLRRRGALLGGVGPMLDAHLLAGVAEQVVDPAGAIARGVDPGAARSESSHTTPSRISRPLPSSHAVAGDTPIPTTTTSAATSSPSPSRTPVDPAAVTLDPGDLDAAPHIHTVARVHPGDDLAHLGAEPAHQRRRRAFQHGHRAARSAPRSRQPRGR